VWALLFGWTLFLGFAAAALVQALTIVGLPTALTFVGFAKFILVPFGHDIRPQYLPTTVAELQAHRRRGNAAQNVQISPLAGRGAPMGDNAV